MYLSDLRIYEINYVSVLKLEELVHSPFSHLNVSLNFSIIKRNVSLKIENKLLRLISVNNNSQATENCY